MLTTPEDLAAFLQRDDLDRYTATMLIELATSLVQRAAGGQRILDITDTASIDVVDLSQELALPQYPIRSVATVILDGTTLTDWRLVNQELWRYNGWLIRADQPSQVLVTYTHGHPAGSQYLQEARRYVLSLCAIGYGNPSQATSEAIDDYKVTYGEAAARMEATDFMLAGIRDAYGASAFITASR